MRIVPLHAANPGPMTGEGNWTYLIDGAVPVLIDAGVGHAAHLDAVAACAPSGPARVLVTHAHSDHISGAPALAARWPRVRFAKQPWPERDACAAVTFEPLHEGQRVPAGDDELEVLHMPGHSPDHLAFWHAASRSVFAGDLVVQGTSVVVPASSGGSLSQYLHSLRRLLALEPLCLLPAHGPTIDDPARIIGQYLEHRLARERQVLAALEGGLTSVEAIAGRIYAGLVPSALAGMARESVLAHLVKLTEDGLARRHGDGWSIVD